MMLAWDGLSGISDVELASASGGELRGRELVLRGLGQETVVDLADRTVTSPDDLGGGWGLITLHHLRGCLDMRSDDEYVSFDQIPSGGPFAQAFRRRAIEPLSERYGKAPEELLFDSEGMGVERMEMADAAVLLRPFPRFKVAVLAWRGDEEVPGRAVMLFDRGGAGTLPAEDLAELGMCLTGALLRKDR